jgi:hypothetical protein
MSFGRFGSSQRTPAIILVKAPLNIGLTDAARRTADMRAAFAPSL